jgi:putative chitinase
MRYTEFVNYELEEGWRETAIGLGTAAAIGAASYGSHKAAQAYRANQTKPTTTYSQSVDLPTKKLSALVQTEPVKLKAPVVAKPIQPAKILPQTPAEHQKFLKLQAEQAGIRGNELTHFLSQMSHETLGFKRLTERGTPEYFQKRYDKLGSPRMAKRLGNTKAGDGVKFIGRGYIQLTGRYNYAQAGKTLGVDLIGNPELAADPEIAAKIAIWYWKKRVQPRVTDWSQASVKTVTTPINPGGKGMKSREQHFQKIKYQKNSK